MLLIGTDREAERRAAEGDGAGKEAAVVVSADAFAALQPPPADRGPWAEFVAGLEGLDLSREPDFGREVELRSAGSSTPM